MQTKIYLRACCIFVYPILLYFFSSLSLLPVYSVLCVSLSSIPIWPRHLQWCWDYVIVFISVCYVFFLLSVKNWATLTNHFEKSDFVCIIHLFNSRHLFAFYFLPFILSLLRACSLSLFYARLLTVSVTFFLSRFFSNWLSMKLFYFFFFQFCKSSFENTHLWSRSTHCINR